jgi:hypothetical protein
VIVRLSGPSRKLCDGARRSMRVPYGIMDGPLITQDDLGTKYANGEWYSAVLSPREFEIGCEWPTGRNRGVVSGAPVWVRTDRESRRRRARQRNCAEFRPGTARPSAWRAAGFVLSNSGGCSTGPKEWLPSRHGSRTVRVSWSENQGLRRFVRDAGPDPTRNYEQFLQIEIRVLTQQRMMKL